MSNQDEIFMGRALELAKKGMYHVAPNPMVGAVIVYQGQIIGEGYHREYGGPHAEVNAIESVKNKDLLTQSTLYVNLEPCSHHGKTPPCSDLIVQMKIKEVVIANVDPSKKVGGKGIEKLKQNGILVRTNVLQKDAHALNKRFLSLHGTGRPHITLKWALTNDGFMGRDPNDPEKNDSWITGPLSKQLVHQWRAEEMGILVGKQTAIIDNPELSVREFKGNHPIRFLIDPQLEVDPQYKIYNQLSMTVVINTIKEGKKGNVEYVKFDNEKMFEALFNFCKINEIHSLLIEGGPFTLQQFIENDHWDEARIFHGSKEFGKGIAGPKFPYEAYKEEKLRGDKIQYFKNPKH